MAGRVNVSSRIRVTMMIAMCFRPPQYASLNRQTSEDSQEELDRARCLERPMSKVAMIANAEAKCAQEKTAETNGHTSPGDTGYQNRKTGDVQKSVRNKNIEAKFRGGESAY